MAVLSVDLLSQRKPRRISAAVYEHCGINLREGQRRPRPGPPDQIAPPQPAFSRSRSTWITSWAHQDGDDFADLIDSLSTNLTSFFRESGHFTYLAREFLPELLIPQTKRSPRRHPWLERRNVSTGEEPYTIAMILREFLETAGRNVAARVLATDISHRGAPRRQRGTIRPPPCGPRAPSIPPFPGHHPQRPAPCRTHSRNPPDGPLRAS